MAWRDVGVVLGVVAAIGCGTLVGAADEPADGGASGDGASPSPESSPSDDSGAAHCTTPASTSLPASPLAVKAIAVGAHHACALMNDTTLLCWGENSSGQVGNATTSSKEQKPVLVAGLSGVTSVALGGAHSCAIANAGELYCWGKNDHGQLGLGNTNDQSSPMKVGTFVAKQVALGNKHTCAIASDDHVSCWGEGASGQLGTGQVNDSHVPVPVSDLPNGANSIAAGWSHACVIVSGGVKCWGANGGAQLGVGNKLDSSIPLDVTGIADVESLALGRRFSCALLGNGEMSCWGQNDSGQLASGGTDTRLTPAASAMGIGKSAQLAAGTDFACQLGLGSGTVRCWGDNDKGELGRGLPALEGPHPDPGALVPSHCAQAIALAGGDDGKFGCALLTNGEVSCWGENDDGELGDGTTTDSAVPTLVHW